MAKKLYILLLSSFLIACSDGDSDSGSMLDDTLPGTNVPANFAGVYTGTTDLTASALGITQSDTFDITITVTEDAMVRFDGDEPDETFTVGLQDNGGFTGTLAINEDECQGSVTVNGVVDGTLATGDVSGNGECELNGLMVDVTLTGTFSASR